MDDVADRDICEATGVWPVRLTLGGMSGWSLWFRGDPDVLLAHAEVVQVFRTREALLASVTADRGRLTPLVMASLPTDTLRRVVDSPAQFVDLDAALDWFRSANRAVTVEQCENALAALNMAADIGATAGDDRVSALLASDSLDAVFDALTFGLSFLGEGTPVHKDPRTMTETITPEAAVMVGRVVALAATHVQAR